MPPALCNAPAALRLAYAFAKTARAASSVLPVLPVIAVLCAALLLLACNQASTEPAGGSDSDVAGDGPPDKVLGGLPGPESGFQLNGYWEPVGVAQTSWVNSEWVTTVAGEESSALWENRMVSFVGDIVFEHAYAPGQGIVSFRWTIKRLPDGRWLNNGIDTLTLTGIDDTLYMDQGILDEDPLRTRFTWRFHRYTGKFPPEKWTGGSTTPPPQTDTAVVIPEFD